MRIALASFPFVRDRLVCRRAKAGKSSRIRVMMLTEGEGVACNTEIAQYTFIMCPVKGSNLTVARDPAAAEPPVHPKQQ
jgi:hypothetical protein